MDTGVENVMLRYLPPLVHRSWDSCRAPPKMALPLLCIFGDSATFLCLHAIQIWWQQDLQWFLTVRALPIASAKLSEKQKHLSLPGRHKELRLIVRYTCPLPMLGWSECLVLTAAYTMHTDACRHVPVQLLWGEHQFLRHCEWHQSGYSLNRSSAQNGSCKLAVIFITGVMFLLLFKGVLRHNETTWSVALCIEWLHF